MISDWWGCVRSAHKKRTKLSILSRPANSAGIKLQKAAAQRGELRPEGVRGPYQRAGQGGTGQLTTAPSDVAT